MRKASRDDGTLYYEYLVCYVDDLIICSQKPEHVIQELRDSGYELKDLLRCNDRLSYVQRWHVNMVPVC